MFCFIGSIGFSQTLNGTVLDAKTNAPIESATIYFDNTTVGVTTNLKGEFTINYTNAIKSPLVISFLGFKKQIITDYRTRNNIVILLEETTEALNEVVAPFILNQEFDLDNRFFKALYLIFKTSGNIETQNGLDTGLSPRQLRRVFNYYIGTTPKAFSKVVRFQHFLNMKPSSQSLKSQKLFFDVGFYDQTHFIKDFKTFYGVTPSQAFK